MGKFRVQFPVGLLLRNLIRSPVPRLQSPEATADGGQGFWLGPLNKFFLLIFSKLDKIGKFIKNTHIRSRAPLDLSSAGWRKKRVQNL